MSTATVIGGGPAGLFAAQTLASAGVSVTVHERKPSPGRKFLLAGHGGLNITHSEALAAFVARYGASAQRIAPMLERFGPEDLRAWCADLGEPTFVGSSGRVFPEAFRATPLFRAWLAHLEELGVRIERRSTWSGWDPDGRPLITDSAGETRAAASDVTLFALGGASWPHLGADGAWVEPFRERGVEVTALRAANVGMRVDWSEVFAERFAGTPLKNVSLTVRGSDAPPQRGDAMLTRAGIEGGPVYAIGADIRAALEAAAMGGADCNLLVDLRPDIDVAQLAQRLGRRRPKDSTSTWLRRALGLDAAAIGLLREARGVALAADPAQMAELIKAVPVAITDTMPIDRAISTAGGIAWSEVDEHLMLRRMPGTFVAGEMLDWEAPTGGYLLQASFSMGATAADGALAWLGRQA
ncbi:NAD(P)/FAD-dependent oxidoreductase [Demequina zhanjiangensis]|uniref:TIGR03862 family flavoprotein n=1 Tax=Demequina zhanjiangensis TaxID=3051659 RepID=A0ABT8G4Z2_9MICO|nr:TIGR03862 family flavoprotein [Demequina sp. SYSU T00b26]MDN4474183.1 TIGR03862 family flavoprotein [Demequina sp. SYSU T00b26]